MMGGVVDGDMMSFLMLATAGKVTLGVLVCLLGLMGLGALALSGWDEEKDNSSWKSELWEGGIFICGLMVVTPFLMLLPEAARESLVADDTTYVAPFEGVLAVLALVLGGGIWLVMRFALPPLRRWLREKPRRPRQGRPSPPGKGRRSKNRRKR